MFSKNKFGLLALLCMYWFVPAAAEQKSENNNKQWVSLIALFGDNETLVPFLDSAALNDAMQQNPPEKTNNNEIDGIEIQLSESPEMLINTSSDRKVKIDTGTSATEIPEGIQNIGRDMILLVDQIIFGEQDPTQRLDIVPLIQDVQDAVSRSPVTNKADLSVAIGNSNIKLAEQSNNVSVTASGGVNYSYTQNSNGSSNRGTSINPTITASKKLFDFGLIEKKIDIENLLLIQKDIEFEKTKNDIILQSLSAFYEVQRALLQSRLARENLAARKTFVNFIRQRMDLGASSSADVIRAEAKVGAALGTLSASLENLSLARANYRKLFGKEAEPYILPREIEIGKLTNQNLEDYIQANPELEIIKLSIQVKEREKERFLIERKGSISGSARIGRTYSESSGVFSDTASFGISYNAKLFDGGIGSTQLETINYELSNLKFEEQRVVLNLRQQIEDAFSEYDGKVSSVDSKMIILEGAKDSYNITKELYSYSRISLFEVLSAQEELFNSGKNLIDSIIDRALSKYRLLYLCTQFEDLEQIG